MATLVAVTPAVGAATALTVGEVPGAPPTSIFPLEGCAQDTIANIQQFQDLLYRPLYWYGLSGSPGYQASLSLATTPTTNRNATTVTFSMRGWRFADGHVVDAESVLFFLNLVDADPSAFCNAVVGRGLPAGLRAVSASGNAVTLTFTSPVDLDWLMGDELSNVVPLDPTWDRTSSGPDAACASGAYGAARTLAACRQVLTYLQGTGSATSGFTSSFWQGAVDGPWRLTSFDATGNASFAANRSYSGPVRPRVGTLRLVAFGSYAAEEKALAGGSLTMGTVPASDVPVGSTNVPALSGHDTLYPTSAWAFSGLEVNAAATDAGGPLVAQGYVRTALEEAIDQRSLVATAFHGFATTGDSPLPAATPTTVASITDPYPTSVSSARQELTAHGWAVSGSSATCIDPGTSTDQCGAGIVAGQPLTLSLAVASGDPSLNQELSQVRTAWSQIGAVVSVTFDTASNVAADCAAASAIDLCWSGGGWSYLSDYYPSGDPFYTTSPATSLGGFANPTLSHWLSLVETRKGQLSGYATYMAQTLPVLYLPTPETLWEVSTSLASARPLRPCPTGALTPEYWYFS